MKKTMRTERTQRSRTAAVAVLLILVAGWITVAGSCDQPTGSPDPDGPPEAGGDEEVTDPTEDEDDPTDEDPADPQDPDDPVEPEDPALPLVAVEAEQITCYEHIGVVTATVRRDTADAELSIGLTVTGTATAGSDYTVDGLVDGSVVMAAGVDAVDVSITVIDDEEVEPEETIVVSVTAAETYEVDAESTVTYTVVSNDAPAHDPVTITITFDTTTEGYLNGAAAGTGFSTEPADGQLDADVWLVSGVSDGEKPFGTEATAGDFARGTAAAGVSTGGLYAFDVAPENRCIGVQPTSSDFTPGIIALEMTNTTGGPIDTVSVSFSVWTFNDEGRSTTVTLVVSTDKTEWIPVEASTVATTDTAAGEALWEETEVSVEVAVLEVIAGGLLADGESIRVGWLVDDAGGSGGRDQVGIDSITLVL